MGDILNKNKGEQSQTIATRERKLSVDLKLTTAIIALKPSVILKSIKERR